MIKAKKDKNHTKTASQISRSWAIIILMILVFPLTWLIVDGTDWLTTVGIRNFINQEPSVWTDAFLGYFASALAATLGFISVLITIHHQEAARREDNRKNVLPLIAINKNNSTNKAIISHVVTNGDIAKVNLNPSNGALVELKNVGMREMYNVKITDIVCDLLENQFQETQIAPIIYKEHSVTIRLQPIIIKNFNEVQEFNPITKDMQVVLIPEIPVHFAANISYQDCYNNHYKQRVKIETSIEANLFENNEDASIVYDATSIKSVGILSAPKLITNEKSNR